MKAMYSIVNLVVVALFGLFWFYATLGIVFTVGWCRVKLGL